MIGSAVLHLALLVGLPGGHSPLDAVEVELIPISADLLRAQRVEAGEPAEPPPAPPAAPAAPPAPPAPPDPAAEAPAPAKAAPATSAGARTRGLAAKLPTNVRFAVIVRPKMLEGSPHERAGRETIRRAIGLRVETREDGTEIDPLAGLDELVVVTQNPFQRGNFHVAASGETEAPPPGYDKKGRDLVRKAQPTRPSKLPPPPRFAWRARLLALADPPSGPRPVVALVGSDVDALTFGDLALPVPPRLELAVFETEEHGSIARAAATFDTATDAVAAFEAWRSALETRCASVLLSFIGLRAACQRIEITIEGKTVHGVLEAEPTEVEKLLGLLQTTMRGRRRSPAPSGPLPPPPVSPLPAPAPPAFEALPPVAPSAPPLEPSPPVAPVPLPEPSPPP